MNFLSLSGVHTPRCRTIKEMGNGTCVYMKRVITFREKMVRFFVLAPVIFVQVLRNRRIFYCSLIEHSHTSCVFNG